MAGISISSSSSYQNLLANAQRYAQASSGSAGTSATTDATTADPGATTFTLSAAARATLEDKPFASVIADAHAAFPAALAAAKATSPLKPDGTLAVDLSGLDRRALWAAASNADGSFTADEQAAAAIEMSARFDAAMAGPTAAARVTGAFRGMYTAALAFLDSARSEQRASPGYARQRAALLSGLDQLAASPNELPADNSDDLVLDYMDRLAAGQVAGARDIGAVASEARAQLDAQRAAAEAAGTRLVFDSVSTRGQKVDFTGFDTSGLSAITLDTGGKFSADEQRAARQELRLRQGAEILASLRQSSSGDPADFASSLISLYGGMSTEERTAAGWSADFYKSVVGSYQSAVKLGSVFEQAQAKSANTDSTATGMSLMDYL